MGRLRLHPFGSAADPLVELGPQGPATYLRYYLADLGATTVLEEPDYFDRDYLSEFSAFYCVSSRGYPNRCRRCHFFSGDVSRAHLRAAAGGSTRAIKRLQEMYLGFVVIRPIPTAPLGRTVLRWYAERTPTTPRVTDPAREYECHVAGVTLSVRGLAWQQQDTGVGACATVALWSMLHSSAFDDHHAIPTTADITRYAHRTASLGARVFPSTGLTIYQLCEAIKESGLAPIVLQGDREYGELRAFSRDRFAAACATLIRSGYPALVVGTLQALVDGELEDVGAHAVCAVGFRECAPPVPTAGQVQLQDGDVRYLYVHDDNLGPNVRFEVRVDPSGDFVRLKASAPPPQHALRLPQDPSSSYPTFVPSQIVTGVHEDLRTSPDRLHMRALLDAKTLLRSYNAAVAAKLLSGSPIGLTLSTRFIKLHEYMGAELQRVLGNRPKTLSRVRLFLSEQVSPMSLHLGVIRIGWHSTPMIDALFDTTDTDSNLTPFCNVQYVSSVGHLASALRQLGALDLGPAVDAYT